MEKYLEFLKYLAEEFAPDTYTTAYDYVAIVKLAKDLGLIPTNLDTYLDTRDGYEVTDNDRNMIMEYIHLNINKIIEEVSKNYDDYRDLVPGLQDYVNKMKELSDTFNSLSPYAKEQVNRKIRVSTITSIYDEPEVILYARKTTYKPEELRDKLREVSDFHAKFNYWLNGIAVKKVEIKHILDLKIVAEEVEKFLKVIRKVNGATVLSPYKVPPLKDTNDISMKAKVLLLILRLNESNQELISLITAINTNIEKQELLDLYDRFIKYRGK